MKRNPVKYNYTDTFRAALELAAEHAKELRCGEITNDLLLWGVLSEGTSAAIRFLMDRNISVKEVLREVDEHIQPDDKEDPAHVFYSIEAHSTLARAAQISTLLGAQAITSSIACTSVRPRRSSRTTSSPTASTSTPTPSSIVSLCSLRAVRLPLRRAHQSS